MKIGKIPENVLKRSILKQIKTIREEVLTGAGVGEDCAILSLKEDEVFVISTDPITAVADNISKLAVYAGTNDLASAGAEPVGIMLSALLPESIEEPQLREMMRQAEEICSTLHIQLMGGHTEVTKAVNQPILTVTAVGKAKKDAVIATKGSKAGQDIVVSKWVGLEGTFLMAHEKETELLTKYPQGLIEEAKSFGQLLSVIPEAATAVRSGVSAMHDVTEGGIFGALGNWQKAQALDLKLI